MRCTELSELVDLYVDGVLPEELNARLERHLLRCPECAFQARALDRTRALLREALPPVEAGPGFRERLAARLHHELEDVLRPEPAETAGQRLLPLG